MIRGIFICLIIVAIIPYLFLKMELIGEDNLVLTTEDEYIEEGAKAFLFGKELKVETTDKIEVNTPGLKKIRYKLVNKIGLIKEITRTVLVEDRIAPSLVLNGSSHIEITKGDVYKEMGVTAIDNVDGNISDKVKISGEVDTTKVGEYQLVYEIEDSSNNKSEITRTIEVKEKEITYLSSYDNLDNTVRDWWPGNKKDHNRPLEGAGAKLEDIAPYNAYYIGPDEKTIYLTFDEGSNDTYLKEIVEVLNKLNVKATFFLCHHYIVSNPEVMKLLASSNQSVGNHTYHHKQMPLLATKENFKEYKNELEANDEAYFEITGKHMDKIYREPKGEWSYRSLQIAKDLGYKTFFWSASYLDFAGELSKSDALEKMMSQYHNGAIYLIHPVNKGNYLALEDFIKNMQNLGYQFGLVKDI